MRSAEQNRTRRAPLWLAAALCTVAAWQVQAQQIDYDPRRAATLRRCDDPLHHGRVEEARNCYRPLLRAPEPLVRAEAAWALGDLRNANELFRAAVDASKHVFMEKPVAVDPVGVRSVIATAQQAKQKRLAVVAGTQRRHQPSYIETIRRIHGGDIGELVGGQCYWNGEGIWFREKTGWLANLSDFEWQCWNWYHWDWLSGDQIVEHPHRVHRQLGVDGLDRGAHAGGQRRVVGGRADDQREAGRRVLEERQV